MDFVFPKVSGESVMLSEALLSNTHVRLPLHNFPYPHHLKITGDLGCYIQEKYSYKYNTWLL